LDRQPLISYILESAINSNVFSKIFINSEDEIFKDIANSYKVEFYKRPMFLSSNTATNDEFAADFIENNPCDVLVQLLPTSPFITSEDIIAFVKDMVENDYDTLISVNRIQIESLFKDAPINFTKTDQTQPSQTLTPVFSYACGIMGWKTKCYMQNMNNYNAAYHGGTSKIGYFELKGFTTIDIDNEFDFQLAEAIILSKKMSVANPQYYSDKLEHYESDVPSILEKDGVRFLDKLDEGYQSLYNLDDIIHSMPQNISWSKRLINTENNSATLICQLPGEGNRLHYHSDWNEWWYILDGQWEWLIEGVATIVKKGDIVFIEKGKRHKITAIGNNPAIRLAVSREDVKHIYPENI
jgi:CMP-N,N'-diacetyllegionaminic acid synthase